MAEPLDRSIQTAGSGTRTDDAPGFDRGIRGGPPGTLRERADVPAGRGLANRDQRPELQLPPGSYALARVFFETAAPAPPRWFFVPESSSRKRSHQVLNLTIMAIAKSFSR